MQWEHLYSGTYLAPEDRHALHLTLLSHSVCAGGGGHFPAGALELNKEV